VAALAFLEDLVAPLPAEELGAVIGARVDPGDAPGVELCVVHTHSRAVLVVEGSPTLRLADVRAIARRGNPDILDGAAFEHALESDLPVMAPRGAVGEEGLCLGFPAADESVVEMHAPSLGARG